MRAQSCLIRRLPMNDRVRIEIADELAMVTLARPKQHNGMDFSMLDAVLAAIKTLKNSKDVRVAVLHGEGPSFCAGLDFKTVLGDPVKAAAGYVQLWKPSRNDFQTWSMGWRELPFPVIAAIHGNCFGAGIQLALGADIRISTPDAKISIMESKWGLIPDMGGGALLRELVGIDVAKELVMTGRTFSGTEAHRLGLVTHVAEDPLAHARAIATEIMTRSPDAVAAGKFLLQEAWSGSEHHALAAERQRQRQLMGRKNQRIAVQRNTKKKELGYSKRIINR